MDAIVQNTEHTRFPSGLRTAEEISEQLRGVVSAARILELAEASYMPCWRIDGKFWFQVGDVKDWLARNVFIEQKGGVYPRVITVTVQSMLGESAQDVPLSLATFSDRLHTLPLVFHPPCVYFLIRGNTVVYVGQSTTLLARISQHLQGPPTKLFDRVVYLPIPKAELLRVESAFIAAIKPEYNRNKNGDLAFSSTARGEQFLEKYKNRKENADGQERDQETLQADQP